MSSTPKTLTLRQQIELCLPDLPAHALPYAVDKLEALYKTREAEVRLDELFIVNTQYRQSRDAALIGMSLNSIRDIDKDLDFIKERIIQLTAPNNEEEKT